MCARIVCRNLFCTGAVERSDYSLIWGSHGGEHVIVGLLGCDFVCTGE
jgi:hypothetical protein